jgi:ATP-dependent DNA helicase RecG
LINYRLIVLPEHDELIDIARKDAEMAEKQADKIAPARAEGLGLLSQLLSPDLRFND